MLHYAIVLADLASLSTTLKQNGVSDSDIAVVQGLASGQTDQTGQVPSNVPATVPSQLSPTQAEALQNVASQMNVTSDLQSAAGNGSLATTTQPSSDSLTSPTPSTTPKASSSSKLISFTVFVGLSLIN